MIILQKLQKTNMQTNIETNIQQQKNELKTQTLLKSKACVELPQKIFQFFYYQSFIICKATKKVIVYNTLNKHVQIIHAQRQDFIVEFMPPYLFALIQGQFITLYQQQFFQGKTQPKCIKISKLQPLTISKFNKGYIMGGYNKSSLPGNKRSTKRIIYIIQTISFTDKNTPDETIKINQSQYPVSKMTVQNPYLIAYCQPTFYIISINTKNILITFQKLANSFHVLQGRFAFSSLNGIGISAKNTIFTFDVEKFPLFGVEVTEHIFTAESLCRQKSGRIFGGSRNTVFEYNPIKRHSKCWALFPQNDRIAFISCTPNNNLMVLRRDEHGKYFIDVFGIQ